MTIKTLLVTIYYFVVSNIPLTVKYRHNTPETNSSSTHTLAIGNPRQLKRESVVVYCEEFYFDRAFLETPDLLIAYILGYLNIKHLAIISTIEANIKPTEFIARVKELLPEYNTLLDVAFELGIEVTEVVPLGCQRRKCSLGDIAYEAADVIDKLVISQGFAKTVRQILTSGVVLIKHENDEGSFYELDDNLYEANHSWIGKIKASIFE